MAQKTEGVSPLVGDAILSHWYSLFEGGHFSALDFYDSLESEFEARKLPKLKASRVAFHEGSALSDKRVYLRLQRERYAFDVCAAPFGTEYFFSLRLIEKKRSWALFAAFMLVAFVLLGFALRAGMTLTWLLMTIAGTIFALWIMRKLGETSENSESPPVQPTTPAFDLDSFVLNIAVIGNLYERTRRDTYYRYDTRLLFLTIVTEIVKRKVEEITSAKGVRFARGYEYNPILGGAYKVSKLPAPTPATAEAAEADAIR